MKTLRKPLLLALPLVLVCTLMLQACGSSDAAVAEAEQEIFRPGVQVQRVAQGDLVRVLTSTATLEARRAATIVSETGGEVLSLLVEEGDHVQKGQVLARLDAERARLSLAQQAATERRLAHENERQHLLQQRKMVSAEAVERSRFDHAAQTAQVNLARLSVTRSEIRAPFSGVITRRHIKPGQMLTTSTPAFDLADFSELEARLSIPESALIDVAVGQSAELSADAFPGRNFGARVDRIAAVVDAKSGTAPITLDVAEAGTPLRPGQLVRVTITLDRIQNALLLPRAAVLTHKQMPVVFVIADSIAHRRPVKLGASQGDQVQVLEGIEEGAEVAVLGHGQLSDADPVEIVQGLNTATRIAAAP
jgi:membrane fusion protein, multidrug efflux system